MSRAAASRARESAAESGANLVFLNLPGFERPLPAVLAGAGRFDPERIGKLEGWLSQPERLAALSRGEGALEVDDLGGGGEICGSLSLFPMVGESGLQGLLCLDRSGISMTAGTVTQTVLPRLVADLGRAIARIAELRSEAAGQGRRIEELTNRNNSLREERDRLQGRIDSHLTLVSNAVHQLRNSLVAVRGYVRMVLGEEMGPITETQRECLAVVMENANKMTGLLSELSRSMAEQPLRYQRFDFVELWRESRNVFQPQILRKAIDLVEWLPDEALTISGDRDKLALVLYKVLANTIKFTGPEGRVEARIIREADRVALTIYDTADGIPPELVEKAFSCGQEQAAGSVPSSSSTEYAAPSLVHEIVRLHGGEIVVTTGINKGWHFTLRVPEAGGTDSPE